MSTRAELPWWVNLLLFPFLNLAAAFAVSALILVAIGEDPFHAAAIIFRGALFYGEGIGYTLFYATNFIFTGLAFAAADVDSSLRAARLYFSIDPMGQKLGAIEPWAPGEEPRLEEADIAASNSANAKLAMRAPVPFPAGEPGRIFDAPVERVDLPPLRSDPGVVMKNGIGGGQSVAAKGEVTG